ncbi:MAG: hypothetical protein RLZZ69_3392, partial [Cyanobacteriota bacterium]
MKKLLLIIAITALATVATAQNTKFGHINSAELIAAMPATKQADSTLKKFAETLDAQYRQMGMDYQTKLGKYQQQRDSLPDAVRKVKEQELEDLGRRIQEYEASAQENLTKKKEELYSPILKRAEDAEAKVFYLKMKGDYNRYIAEYAQGELKDKVSQAALDAYALATKDAKELSPINPISLGLALNFSVFYYEVMGDHEKACKIAKDTLDLANKEMASVEDPEENENYRDALSIINLLR